ncbi:MAG: DUF551 domain-containing protein [Minwuia sp.]|nr:DUF551 domain-containing protein [Minwuia sp.]
MAGWLPIRTAPQDGMPVLVYVPEYQGGRGAIITAVWMKRRLFGSGWYDSGATQVEPSHWQPLPDPPV